MRIAIKTPQHERQSPSPRGQFLRTQNFSSLVKEEKGLDIKGFPAGSVRRSSSPGPAGGSPDCDLAISAKKMPFAPIPYYLRGKAVNDKMLTAGMHPGMAMGFQSDYERHD
jgi:hypothetical protein